MNLKLCPFCGGEARIADEVQRINGKSNGGQWKYVYCTKCGGRSASFYWDDRKDMINAWNRRAEDVRQAD